MPAMSVRDPGWAACSGWAGRQLIPGQAENLASRNRYHSAPSRKIGLLSVRLVMLMWNRLNHYRPNSARFWKRSLESVSGERPHESCSGGVVNLLFMIDSPPCHFLDTGRASDESLTRYPRSFVRSWFGR